MLCPSRRLTLDDIAAATKQRVLTVCAGRIATGKQFQIKNGGRGRVSRLKHT